MSPEKSNSRSFTPLNLNLIEFKIINESINQPEYFDEELLSEYDSKISVNAAFNVKDELIRFDYTIELETSSKNTYEAKANFSFVFIFEYKNFNDVVRVIDKKLKASAPLGRAIFAVSHSTIRGILLMKLGNSVFSNFILPIADPAMENFINKTE